MRWADLRDRPGALAAARADRTMVLVDIDEEQAVRDLAAADALAHVLACRGDATPADLDASLACIAGRPLDVADFVEGSPVSLSVMRGALAPAADALEALLSSHRVSGRISRRSDTVLDELLTNAHRHAEKVSVRLVCDGARLGIEVTDSAGALSRAALAGFFAHLASLEPLAVDHGSGGAGLGLMMVYTSVNHLLIGVQPGRRTRVVALLDIQGGVRGAARSGHSLNLFMKESS